MGPDGSGVPLLPTEFFGDFPDYPKCRAWTHGTLKILASMDHWYKGKSGQGWRHVSISHARRYPTWDEIMEVRNRLFQPSAVVVQFLAGKDDHLCIHENCFHLWERLDQEWELPTGPRDLKVQRVKPAGIVRR